MNKINSFNNVTEVIIGCIIANILTLAIVGFALFILFKKNEKRLNEIGDELRDKIKGVKDTVDEVVTVIDSIKNMLDKLPFSK